MFDVYGMHVLRLLTYVCLTWVCVCVCEQYFSAVPYGIKKKQGRLNTIVAKSLELEYVYVKILILFD